MIHLHSAYPSWSFGEPGTACMFATDLLRIRDPNARKNDAKRDKCGYASPDYFGNEFLSLLFHGQIFTFFSTRGTREATAI